MVCIDEGADAAHDIDFTHFCHTREAGGEFADHRIFVVAQFVDIHLWRGKTDAVIAHGQRFFHDGDGVQQGFGRHATDVQAGAAEGRPTFDASGLEAQLAGVDMELAIAVGDRDAAQCALKEMNAQTGARMAARFAAGNQMGATA